jgi:hypothetical protein
MKKQVQGVIVGLACIVSAIFTVVSCSKSEQPDVIKEGKVTRFSPGNEKTEPLIKAFIERYDSYKTGYKTGGGDIALGEAVWTLEAATNYEFRGSKESLTNFSYDSLITMVTVSIGENNEYFISESEAMGLYEDLVTFTGNALTGENEVLLVADLETKSVENNEAEITFVTVKGGIGTDPCTTNATDYWFPVMGMGKCGAYSGSEGKDATDIIDRIINCAQVMADYWTDVVVYQFLYDEYCNDEPVFWSGNYDDCLSPEEITHWSNMANCLIGDLKPQGKSRIIADIEWDFLLSVSWVHYMHYLSYGVPHSSGGGTK